MYDDTQENKILARNLKRLMCERGLSNIGLSRKSGVAHERISIILRAKSGITVHTLRKLREALQCTWEDLLD